MKTFLLLSLIVFTLSSRSTIYMCHDDPFKDEQCLKKEIIGSNTFAWVRKCKGAKVCVTLPYYGEIIGSCLIKVRSHYDGESCANGNKCTSGNCDGSKCVGRDEGIQCEPGLGQCKKGLLCRYTLDDDGNVFEFATCEKPIQPGNRCGGLGSSSFSGEDYLFSDPSNLDPGYNVCTLGYTCNIPGSSSGVCVRIGSIATSTDTSITNPLACETGLVATNGISGGCATTTSDTRYTSRGLSFTNYGNATAHFNDWLTASTYDDDTEDEDAIYEAYRYTRNKKKINELWFRYIKAHRVDDADECAYDYFWKNSSQNYIKFSLMILLLTLLF